MTETKIERDKKRAEIIAAKKKDVEVIAKSRIVYDGEDIVDGEEFKMAKSDYDQLKATGAVISKADKARQDEARSKAKKESLKDPKKADKK